MRRLLPIRRCSYPRCATASRRSVFAILVICLTIAGIWKLLVLDHKIASGRHEGLFGASKSPSSADSNQYPAIDRSSATGRLNPSCPVTNSDATEAKRRVPNPGLSPERFNAALAAGLIDPSAIALLDPKSESRLATLAVETLKPPAAANLTKSINAAAFLATAIDQVVSAPACQTAEAATNVGMLPSPQGKTLPKTSIPKNKPVSVHLVEKARMLSEGGSSLLKAINRNDSLPNSAKARKQADQRTNNRDSQMRDLTENLQRFASDFVKADQTGNIAEQQRFYAESVHFYREGDLSLAGVVAATRRYHHDQQTIRSELAGPAVAVGPVNGGFFVIGQPVRWTRSRGSKVTQGRSMLRLRVVPIIHGGWKITSIDEVNN